MSAPRPPQVKANVQPAQIQRGESFADIPTRADAGEKPQEKRDAFTQGGRSAAAKALVQTSKAKLDVAIPAGVSSLLDVTMRLAASAYDTRQIDEGKAAECAAMLDRAHQGFDVRLAHLVLERACEQALIGSRARQRLSSSLNAALGRAGERLGQERAPNVDSLGLVRGETGFSDLLLEAVKDRKSSGLSSQRLDQLKTAVREIKTADALRSAYDALAKLFPTPVLSRVDRQNLLAAFLQSQGRLRANVIAVTSAMGTQGVMAFAPPALEKALAPSERQALEARLKNAPIDELQALRAVVVAIIKPPLFRQADAKALLAITDQRLMMLRAL